MRGKNGTNELNYFPKVSNKETSWGTWAQNREQY